MEFPYGWREAEASEADGLHVIHVISEKTAPAMFSADLAQTKFHRAMNGITYEVVKRCAD